MKKMMMVLALSTTALGTTAYAGEPGPYVSIDGGGVLSENQHIYGPTSAAAEAGADAGLPGATSGDTIHNKLGWTAGGQAGYDFGFLRIEGDVNYERLRIKRLYTPVGTLTSGDGLYGRTASFSAMGNALAEFGPTHGPQLYAGGGVGWARTHEEVDVSPTGGISGRNSRFAWELIGGVDMPVGEHVSVGLRYRYFHPDADRFHFSDGTTEFVKLRTHSVMGNLTYHFGSPTPPPPPPPRRRLHRHRRRRPLRHRRHPWLCATRVPISCSSIGISRT